MSRRRLLLELQELEDQFRNIARAKTVTSSGRRNRHQADTEDANQPSLYLQLALSASSASACPSASGGIVSFRSLELGPTLSTVRMLGRELIVQLRSCG